MKVFPVKVSDIIEQVRAEMCDQHCKWPEAFKEMDKDENALLEEMCEDCPLNRL